MQPDGGGLEVFVNTGGRPLGMAFDAISSLIVTDTHLGLIAIAPDKKISVLVNTVNGEPLRFADAVVMASSGLNNLPPAKPGMVISCTGF